MHAHRNRKTLLASAAVGAVAIVMSMGDADVARADSACLVGLTTTTCTAPNGTITTTFSGGALVTIINPSAVVYYNGGFISATVTGNIESSTTPLKGVLNFDAITAPTFTYVGTGSLLDSTTTGSTALRINAPSAVINTGALSVLANGGTGLSVISSGGAGSGGITTVVDGNIVVSNGNGVIMTTSNAAADGALSLTINSGSSVTAANGTAVNVNTAGAGNITATNNGGIGSTGTNNTLTNGIIAQSTGTGSVSVTGTGQLGTAADRAQADGINASINNAASTGAVSVTPTGSVYAVGNAIDASTNGTGTVTVNAGGTLDSNGSTAVLVNSSNAAAGAVSVTTAAGGTVRSSGGDGINVTTAGSGNLGITSNANISSSAAGANTLQNGIVATDTGTGAVSLAVGGAIGTAGDRAQGIGIKAAINNAASSGNISIGATGLGGIYSVGDAINANTTGTGSITIGTNGPLNSSANFGIFAGTTSGNENITTGGTVTGTTGISAFSNSGIIVVNANNNVTGTAGSGITANSAGAKTVNVAAGRTVTGSGVAVTLFGNGAGTVNNNGSIGTAGGISVLSSLSTPVTVNNAGSGTINGRFDLSTLNDTINNSGALNLTGTNNFYAGTDVINNNSGGVLNLATGTSFTGLETINNATGATANAVGTVTFGGANLINNGTFNTAAGTTLTGLNTTFGNAGVFNAGAGTTISGLTTMSNSGVLNLATGTFTTSGAFSNTGTINATSGASTITGQTSFTNSGLINLQDGAANDTLTIGSNYVGTGGSTLAIDAADAVGDMLVVNGTVSGSTLVDVNLLGTGLFLPGGLLVVDATGSTTNAFSLGGVTGSSPLVDIALVQNGADYYLASTVNATGFAPLLVGLIGPDLWYQSADAYIDQMHLPNDGTGRRMGLWGKIYFGHDKSGGRDGVTVAGTGYNVDNRYKTDRYGVQLGYGFPIGGMGTVGVTGGYGHADTDGVAAGYSAHGWNIGAYGMFGGPVGFHGSALLKYDNYKVDIDGVFDGADGNPDVKSWGVDGEVGYKFGSADTMWWDVFAGLSYVRTKIDDISLGTINYDYDRLHSTRGRLGGRMTFAGDWGLFADATLYHEFSGNSDVTLSDGVNAYRLRTDGHGTWGRLSLGVGGPGSGIAPELSGWVDVGDQQGIGVTAGMRF